MEGDVNDYWGKGFFGGMLVFYLNCNVIIVLEENIVVGNVCFYGVIFGEFYICGLVGECFCVCNLGVKVVVEGIGDYGCEYMTGGVVVIFGLTGCNFVVGMSGGVVYVWDKFGDF